MNSKLLSIIVYDNTVQSRYNNLGSIRMDGVTSFCLIDLILYVPSTIFQLYRDGSFWVEPVLS